MWLVVITAALVLAVLLYFHHCYSHFRRKGVKHGAVVPLFGNMKKFVFQQECLASHFSNVYFEFPGERFVGCYEFTKPVIVLRDLELIKKVTVKDFEHFIDHCVQIDFKNDPIFCRNLFSLKGQEWKDMRSTMSPAFTSSKLKHMVPFMVDVGDQMIINLKKTFKESENDYLDLDVKDLTTRFSNDVIASCAFGLRVDSHTERNNEFFAQVRTATNFQFRDMLKIFLFSSLPWLMNLLKIPLFNTGSQQFFRHLVTQTMQNREEKNIIRPDMIHLLMEAKKGKLSHDEKTTDTDAGFATVKEFYVGKKKTNRVWSDDDLIAQAVAFFIAGLDTVTVSMSFLLYELAVNPDVQEKLAQEIKETDARTGGKFDYNDIQNMPYMDMVVSEILRLWSPGIFYDRMCRKDYNLGKPNEKAIEDYIIRAGDGVQIPVWAIHHDPAYFPDPYRFDPERFSDKNKHNIKPYSYSPFGLGPRNCIGSRLALTQLKILAYKLLLHMEVVPGPKTTIPAELDVDSFNPRMKGGHWLQIRVRN